MSKIAFTLRNIKKTAYHHYGKSWSSLPKFIYYSVLHINTFVLLVAELDKELPAYPLEPEFRVIKPSLEELDKLREGKDLSREFYYDKIHGVKTCYLILHGEEIANIFWLYFKGDHNRFLTLSDNSVELNYTTTLPKFRGKDLMSKLQAYILRDLQKQGYQKAVGVVNEKNIPGIKCGVRVGFREVRRFKTIGPFNRKIRV